MNSFLRERTENEIVQELDIDAEQPPPRLPATPKLNIFAGLLPKLVLQRWFAHTVAREANEIHPPKNVGVRRRRIF